MFEVLITGAIIYLSKVILFKYAYVKTWRADRRNCNGGDEAYWKIPE